MPKEEAVGQGPLLTWGHTWQSVNAERHRGKDKWAYQTRGSEKAYSILLYICIFRYEKYKPVGFVMQITGSK